MTLKMDGCCIREAALFPDMPDNPDVVATLERYKQHIMLNSYPTAHCDGRILSAEEEAEGQREIEDVKRACADNSMPKECEAERWAKIRNEAEARDRVKRLSEAPAILRKMPLADFCLAYGQSIRGERVPAIGNLGDLAPILRVEAGRRKIKFDDGAIRGMVVRIGMSECQLYASLGFPKDERRSVGAWGTHVQHIYGRFGPYIYTENGRVTAWQD